MKKEKMLQGNVIKRLNENGWENLDIKNLGQLEWNFRNIINQINKEKLQEKNVDFLSDLEFERLMNKIANNTTNSDYAKFLLDDSCVITLDNGQDIYLNLFNKKRWCTNKFQVVSELTNNQNILTDNRYDILLLINGFPLANIELKHSSVKLNNAFEQTKRYQKGFNGLLKFIQIFIISNENNTNYYANNQELNAKFAFTWVDEHNNRVNNIFDFIDHFLAKCNFSEYISRYVINQEKSNTLLALRGYQVHAVKKIIEHINVSNENGYIWHTTGSGKTITSFKTAQIINRDCDVDRVIFLVDRKDLDSQTYNEYNSFLGEHEKLEETNNTNKLRKQLNAINQKLIVSTIQKMNRVLTNNNDELVNIKNQRVIFIIDECHRSTFGEMYQRIKESFTNAQYIGFTGTPLFDHVERKKHENVTNDVFNKCLHKYLIKNAIEDRNVLPFQMEYYENEETNNVSQYVKSDQYISTVVSEIIKIHDTKTIEREFFAIVTFADVNTLIKAYDVMKQKQNERKKLDSSYKMIKTAAVFSSNAEENEYKYENQEKLYEIINDFNNYTNSNESIKEISKYENRLQSVIKSTKAVAIDLVFVVDKLLTGFDAKLLNTIYIAKNLKRHNLIQAMSRTNRLFNVDKKSGMVVSFVPNLKQEVDAAVKLYSNSLNSDAFSSKSMDALLDEARSVYANLKNINIEKAKEEPIKYIQTINAYKQSAKDLQELYNEVKTFRHFSSELIGKDNNGEDFSIDKMKEIVSTAFTLDHKLKEIIQQPDLSLDIKEKIIQAQESVDMPLKWSDRTLIDHVYIMKLIAAAQESGNYEDIKNRHEEAVEYYYSNEELQQTSLAKIVENLNLKEDIFEQLVTYQESLYDNLKDNYNMSEQQIEQEIRNLNLKEEYKPSKNDKIANYLKDSGYKIKERKQMKMDIDKMFYTINALNKIIESSN